MRPRFSADFVAEIEGLLTEYRCGLERSEKAAESTHADRLRAELAELGEEKWRGKYGAVAQMSPVANPGARDVLAIIAELDRKAAAAHEGALLDQGAAQVGHSDNANRIARRANWISLLAVAIAVVAALKAWDII